jgi:hypothetical protein
VIAAIPPNFLDVFDEEYNNDKPKNQQDDDDDLQDTQSLLQEIRVLSTQITLLENQASIAETIAIEADDEVVRAKRKLKNLQIISDDHTNLDEDTFTLMMTARPGTKTWWFGIMIFVLQMCLSILVFAAIVTKNSTPFGVPFDVPGDVRTAQVLAVIVIVGTAKDVIMPIKEMSMLWITNKTQWAQIISDASKGDVVFLPNWKDWTIRILLPNLFKFTEGSLVLVLSFVIIIQSDSVPGIFLDLTVMHLISELDNVAFWLATHGYFGTNLKHEANEAKQIQVKDDVHKLFGWPLRPLILLALLLLMMSSFLAFALGQTSGTYFRQKYQHCGIKNEKIVNIGDGKCHGGLENTYQCGFDGGDCISFNIGYPKCNAAEPFRVGDGHCDDVYNTVECLFDGGDCCRVLKNDTLLGDGICHGGFYNTRACKYDNGDCTDFRTAHPYCPDFSLASLINGIDNIPPFVIGDGTCDFNAHYMNEECGNESGDCGQCIVDSPELLVNGKCDGGQYNTDGCHSDNGDCTLCNGMVEDRSKIGNGFCDGGDYMDDSCSNDGGDCEGCKVDDSSLVGDGKCNGGAYMSEYCSNDGGDCDGCEVDDPSLVGNGICNGPKYMSDACSNDGGDCDGCKVKDLNKLGDGLCDGGEYNTRECGWDAGDCDECRRTNFTRFHLFSDGKCDIGYFSSHMNPACNYDGGDCVGCEVELPALLGDGTCNGGAYATAACKFDNGDCYQEEFPNCNHNGKLLGNRDCDKAYNTESCGWDGGDCVEHNEELFQDYPNCFTGTNKDQREKKVADLGDKYCNKLFNNQECGWDDGDCLDFNKNYPNCTKPINPYKIGNGECNHGTYNSPECEFDGGDCIERNDKVKALYPECKYVNHPYNPYIGDILCHSVLNIESCGFDGGDCKDRNDKLKASYPHCKYFPKQIRFIGNNECDPKYNIKSCGWDGGDCEERNGEIKASYPHCPYLDHDYIRFIGDGSHCFDPLNIESCGWDGGDCVVENNQLRNKYPNCTGLKDNPSWHGNTTCEATFNNVECGWDGGDCHPDCSKEHIPLLGNNVCNYQSNTEACGWDEGDCTESNNKIQNDYPNCNKVQYSILISNNVCNYESNTEACGWDGGDCEDSNNKLQNSHPNCTNISFSPWFGDANCNPELNSVECDWDGGDCEEKNTNFQKTYPNCKNFIYNPWFGNGKCDAQLNNIECGWDGGDCHPDCPKGYLPYLGNNVCSYQLNTEACDWDGGDCDEINNKVRNDYPNCPFIQYSKYIDDNVCQPSFNTTDCGWDGGDCVDSNNNN